MPPIQHASPKRVSRLAHSRPSIHGGGTATGSHRPLGFGGRLAVARSGPGLVRRVVARAPEALPPDLRASGRAGSSCVCTFGVYGPKRTNASAWRDPVSVSRPFGFVIATAPEGVRSLVQPPRVAEHLSQPDTHLRRTPAGGRARSAEIRQSAPQTEDRSPGPSCASRPSHPHSAPRPHEPGRARRASAARRRPTDRLRPRLSESEAGGPSDSELFL
jgi:hypothetical protein